MTDELNLEAERAAWTAHPNPNSPHTSVNMRAENDRAAFKAGYLAARRTPSAEVSEGELPPLPDFLKWWTSIETDARKVYVRCTLADTESLYALLRRAFDAGGAADRRSGGSAGGDEMRLQMLQAERDHAHARLNHAVKILSGIHTAIYPQLHTVDGKTYRFTAPDPHLYLQALADRIRAIPDELAAIKATESTNGR